MQGYQDRRIVVKSGSITLENSHLFNSHSNFTKKVPLLIKQKLRGSQSLALWKILELRLISKLDLYFLAIQPIKGNWSSIKAMFGTELLNIRKYILYYSKHLIINISFKYSVVYDIISGKLVIFSGSYRHCTCHVTLHYMYISAGQSHNFVKCKIKSF